MKIETSKKLVGVLKYYNYNIDIIQDFDNYDCFEFWLYKEDETIKMYCLGLLELDLEVIKNNIEKWIKEYNEQFIY